MGTWWLQKPAIRCKSSSTSTTYDDIGHRAHGATGAQVYERKVSDATPAYLELREADHSKFFASIICGRDRNHGGHGYHEVATVLIWKRDINAAVHIISPEASEVTIQYKCLLTIGRLRSDLANCYRSRLSCFVNSLSALNAVHVGATAWLSSRASAEAMAKGSSDSSDLFMHSTRSNSRLSMRRSRGMSDPCQNSSKYFHPTPARAC